MLRRSTYRHRYLFALLGGGLLTLLCAWVLVHTFLLPSELTPVGPINTPLFSDPLPPASPVQKVSTDTRYVDDNIEVTVTHVTENKQSYFVADIKLRDIRYFRTAFANDKYGRNMKVATSVQAKNHKAILAISGDYCVYSRRDTGLIIRNGTLYSNNPYEESLVLMRDGTMVAAGVDVDGNDLLAQGALHNWHFGPMLVRNGLNDIPITFSTRSDPRSGLGMVSPLHYVFIVAEGRTRDATGPSLRQFAQMFIKHGCTIAYNLDGGGTATMVMNNKLVNKPTYGSEREISDIIYIGLK